MLTSNSTARLQDLTAKLKKRGFRLTPQRLAVLKILSSSSAHPTAEQIYAQVKVDFPTTSLATIYKTLALLQEEGEILELGFGDGSNRYDGLKPYAHPHLICVCCKRILDLEFPVLEELSKTMEQEYGYQIISHRLDIYGICPNCQRQGGAG